MRKIFSAFFILIFMLLSSITVYALDANNVQVVSNGYTTFLIESNGTVKGFGSNNKGEVGNGTTIDQHTPVAIQGLTNIKEIIPNDYGNGFFFAIDTNGNVYGWGYNGYGQLGLGVTSSPSVPTQITSLPEISKIRINEYTVYAITPDGYVYSTGKNDYGQVGNGTKTTQRTFTKIPQLSNVADIVCKSGVAFALTESKEVYAWGRGDDYQTGIGGYIAAQLKPVQITDLSNVDEVITNGVTSFAICNNRQDVYSWGEGWLDELGTYSERNRKPTRIWVLSDLNESIEKLVIEQNTAFAITSDNTLYGWGANSSSQLCNGGTYDQGVPKPIMNIPKANQFIFNGNTGIVLGVDGWVYTWGKNSYGEVGTGDQSRIGYAEKLLTLGNNIERIFDGNNAMYAVKADGTVYGWGSNNKRQLAIGYTTGILPPTIIQNICNITNIDKTKNTVFASDSQNVIYGWGENQYGQIGNDTTDDVITPFIVSNSEMKTTTGTGDVNSTVPIVGEINALEISFTHPLNIAYSIDPNVEDGFYCADIQISNNSKVPVKVRIETFEASSEGDLIFQDVLPSSMDWNGLNRQETKSYIALALKYADESQWLISQSELVNPLYAVEIDNTYIGVLAKASGGTLKLCGMHGLAFDGNYTAKHELIFIVSLL